MALTVKQEAFCCSYIENGGNASEAYRAAYVTAKMQEKTIWEEASRLLADPKVSARVRELMDAIAKRHDLTVDDILAELEEAREMAKLAAIPQIASMVAASMGKAKVAGLIRDKQEITGANGGPIQKSMTVTFVSA